MPNLGSYAKTRRSPSNLNLDVCTESPAMTKDPRYQIVDRLAHEIRPELQFYAGFIDFGLKSI